MKRKLLSLFLALMMLGTVIMSIPVSAELNFNDTDGHWGEAAIEYVVENGLMNGVGNGESFAPNMSLTRGMVVTVLYRDNGSPKTDFSGTFLDVAEGAYYTAAAEWAYANGIVNGTGTNDWGEPYFSPDRDITRQELATMFKRYADFKHVDTAKGAADIATFPDAASVADWAKDAVKWAVGTGLITGKSNGGAATLSPVDKAVRAEFATIIKRFKEASFEYRLVYNAPVPKSTFTEIPYAKVENADIYVAVDGSDTNPGTLAKPLATFEAAKAKVRELKKTAKDEIVVAFKAGDYGIIDNLQFTSDDSGTEKVPVTYCAYGDGEVYFTNGVFITESDFKPLDEKDKLLFTEANADNIKKVELAGHPAADKIGSFSSLSNEAGFCWLARIPNKRGGVDNYFPGFTEHVTLPDSQYKTIDELYIANEAGKLSSTEEVSTHIDHNKLQTLHTLKDKLCSYKTLEGAQLIGYIGKNWHQDTLDITGFDKETGIVSTTAPYYIYYAMLGNQQQAYLNNVSEELDDKGEYFIDPATKTLYVYKPQGNYNIATNDTFLTVNAGANFITFTKLNFRTCNGIGINLNGDNCTMDQCSVTFVGGDHAIYSEAALNIKITNSTLAYCAEYGISVMGPRAGRREGYVYYDLKPTGFVFENNLVHDIGMKSVSVGQSGLRFAWQIGATISHNEIYNSSRYAIDFGKSIECVMEYNYLHDCMQNSADGGAIYGGRSAIHRGNIFRYNIVSDIYPVNPVHTGGTYAIYLDDGQENFICYGNVFYNSGMICNNNGSRHEFTDNVFIGIEGVNANPPGIWGKEGTYDIRNYVDVNLRFNEGWNGFHNVPDINTPNGQLWFEKWPELYDILAIINDPTIDVTKLDLYSTPLNICKNNYSFGKVSNQYEENWLKYSIHENNPELPLTENPFFVNPTLGDYTVVAGADLMDNHYELIGRY